MHDQRCTQGSICNIVSGLCECTEREVAIGNTCQPQFVAAGSPCALEQKCLGGSLCKNGICTCPVGYQLMVGYCIPPKATVPAAAELTRPYASHGGFKPLPQDLRLSLFNRQSQFPTKHFHQQGGQPVQYSISYQSASPNVHLANQQYIPRPIEAQQPTQLYLPAVARQQPGPLSTLNTLSSGQPVQPGYPCVAQDICIGGAICFQGVCSCPAGTMFSNGICDIAPITLKPGDHCGNGGACGGNSVCSFSWCRCLNGTINENGYCTPITLQSSLWNYLLTSPINQNSASNHQKNQVSSIARPNESCGSGQTCTGRSVCMPSVQGMTCQCPLFTALFTDQCVPLQRLPITATVGQSCAAGESCSGGSFCQGGICRCPVGTEVYYGHCLQLAAPGQSCALGEQCGGGSVCDRNLMVCLCESNSRQIQGRCERISNFLQAAATRREHSFAGLPCNVSIPCMDNSYCSATGYCVCEPGHVQMQRRCIPKDAMVELGFPCNHVSICAGGSFCINGICSCINGTNASQGECKIGKARSAPLESCSSGEECTGNAICLNDVCLCPDGSMLDEDTCVTVSKLGQPCNSGQRCQQGLACDGFICNCPPGTTAESGECLPSGLLANPGATCFHGEICAGGSFCNASACICRQDQNPVLDRCETPVANVRAGGACSFTFHCQMGLTCMFGVCKCLPYDDGCPGLHVNVASS